MTERKPHGTTFETWIDRQVREAMERGEFDNLPGAGKPITGTDKPYDEMWWVKQKLRHENVSVLPPTLALRKEAEDAIAAATAARSELEVRHLLTDINRKIRTAITRTLAGPPLNMVPFDVEQVVAKWRTDHPQERRFSDASGPRHDDAAKAGPARYLLWWQRIGRWG
ncbi:MAG: DnaJ family domain-containing protein [Acidimicrobiales bacterium]